MAARLFATTILSSVAFGVCLASAASELDRYILTPAPGPAPKINGPVVYGARPDRPFLYRIPCTGNRPIRFSATGLPPTLRLDPDTGIIRGKTPAKKGTYEIAFKASNTSGEATRRFRLKVGDQLALTPPMGWNDWYTHYAMVTDKLMREAADVMVSSGMADFGYEYVNIDDCWMMKPGSDDPLLNGPERDSAGAIRPNGRFPDMKALTDYIHAKGLKAGIYTSPGPLTCARFTGSYQHEEIDARKFAEWGFDFVKYDWCSYTKIAPEKTLPQLMKPYELMGGIVASLGRDVIFNLCEYGMGDVWKWGATVGGHAWRTTGDVGVQKDTHLPGFYTVGMKNAELAEFAGPGRWNDPDYILIGKIGNNKKRDAPPSPTTLTLDEQYSYMSMWALMAAPLFFSGDMGHLDAFTLNVLCNSEVIDIDQDALGTQARIVRRTDDEFVLAKPLEDGSLAVGLFNLTTSPRQMSAAWTELGIKGTRKVRDAWRQKDIGAASDRYSAAVNAHGVALVRLLKPQ
jgi:alpha-galactosidase